jgi:hypothetical protein
MTRIVSEGSRLANQTALYHVTTGDQFPFNTPEGALKYMRQCFQAVTTYRNAPDTTNEPIINNIRDTLYTQYRPQGMSWTNKKSLGQLLSSAARQYVTNCQNHITTNLETRLKRWIKYKLFKIHQFPLPKKHINSIINHFITNLKNRDPPSLPSNIIDKLSTPHPEYLIHLTTRVHHIHLKVQTLFQNQALDDVSVKASWWSYLPGLHKILRTFTKHNWERGLHLFTLLPEYSFQQKYILIDTDALYYMYKSIGKEGVTTIQRFRNEKETWWMKAFNVNKVTTQNRIFAYSIQTDGLAVSVGLQKKVGDDKEDIDEEGSNIDLDGCKVFGLDPGRKDLFTAVGEDEKVVKCSNKEYWNLAGFVRARKKREVWLENNKFIQAVIRGELYFVNLICC